MGVILKYGPYISLLPIYHANYSITLRLYLYIYISHSFPSRIKYSKLQTSSVSWANTSQFGQQLIKKSTIQHASIVLFLFCFVFKFPYSKFSFSPNLLLWEVDSIVKQVKNLVERYYWIRRLIFNLYCYKNMENKSFFFNFWQ